MTLRKGQLFSVDFLLAIAMLTMALAIFVNSYSQLQANSAGEGMNPDSYVKAQELYDKFSSGMNPTSEGCTLDTGGVSYTCRFGCSSADVPATYVQRLYQDQNEIIHALRVAVCS